MLLERRAELEKQLERMAVVAGARVVQGGGSVLKGRKVPPKYRSRSGETWAGRGQNLIGLLLRSKAEGNSTIS
jgi:DNA-binding protein H-NS